MRNFISVVSHGHAKLIKELNVLPVLAKDNVVVIKCNKESDVDSLGEYCALHNIYLLSNDFGKGFGANNNIVFEFCKRKFDMNSEDYFTVLNPDLKIDLIELRKLYLHVEEDRSKLSTINLYKDEEMTLSDDAIRRFPQLKDFFISLLLKKNATKYDKASFRKATSIDWAAGSFLMFECGHYEKLNGFDEKYFMYCEDIDICYRSNLLNHAPMYYPDVYAIHLARHANRSVFSKHFYWHLRSALIFLKMKYKNPINKYN
ncbi:TPA: glycosyltransferase family 2 protein [Escherichia coli]